MSYYILFAHAILPLWLKRQKVVVKWLNSFPKKHLSKLTSLFKHPLTLFWTEIHTAVEINQTKSGAASSLTVCNWAGLDSSQLISSQGVWKSWRQIDLDHGFLLSLICFEAAVHLSQWTLLALSAGSLGGSVADWLLSANESDNVNANKVVFSYTFCCWILPRLEQPSLQSALSRSSHLTVYFCPCFLRFLSPSEVSYGFVELIIDTFSNVWVCGVLG